MTALLRILALWRADAPLLVGGAAVSLLAVGARAGLSVLAGATVTPGPAQGAAVGGTLLLWWLLRGLGVGRVVLRYAERLLTHRATFRALAGLRVWMFRGLAARSAGGLGMLRSGDALARLVGDVEALDGLYIRIMVPAAATLVLLPALAVALGAGSAGLALGVGSLFLAAALAMPLAAARGALDMGGRLAAASAGLRVAALDALGGMREVRAFGAEGRMLAAVQAREATLFQAQRALARRAALAQAAAFLCGQAALLAVLLGPLPAAMRLPSVLLTLVAFEVVGAMPRRRRIACWRRPGRRPPHLTRHLTRRARQHHPLGRRCVSRACISPGNPRWVRCRGARCLMA